MRHFWTVLAALAVATWGTFAEVPQNIAAPPRFVVGISPYLDKPAKDPVYRSLVRLLVEDLPLGSTLSVYDAFELKTIIQVNVPAARVFSSAKTRANHFAPAIRDLKQFLAQDHTRPSTSHLTFEAALRLPQFMDFLAENLRITNSTAAVLLIGSPLYQDQKEPGFSMVDGYFPSDGHLQASRERSIFGFSGDATVLSPLRVHWVYFGDPWINDLHKEKVTRFWTLYLEQRGAHLATFTGDLTTTLNAFGQTPPPTTPGSKQWTVDTSQSKIEMLRAGRSVEATDWLTRDTLPNVAPAPPRTMVGPLKIGIRWKENIDLDLYATPSPGAETLFFQHVRSPEGYYYKDHRSSPGKDYEFIEFEEPVDIRKLQACVNFYKGHCAGGPSGEVRIEFDGRIYAGPFSISAEHGNLGRADSSQGEFWTRIPVLELLKVAHPIDRAG